MIQESYYHSMSLVSLLRRVKADWFSGVFWSYLIAFFSTCANLLPNYLKGEGHWGDQRRNLIFFQVQWNILKADIKMCSQNISSLRYEWWNITSLNIALGAVLTGKHTIPACNLSWSHSWKIKGAHGISSMHHSSWMREKSQENIKITTKIYLLKYKRAVKGSFGEKSIKCYNREDQTDSVRN